LGAALSGQIREVAPYPDQSGNIMYFIVHLNPSGLVIVPGDDLVEPIVGFVIDTVSYDPSEDNPLGALVSRDLPGRVLTVRERERNAQVTGTAMMDTLSTAAQAKWRLLEGDTNREATTEGGLGTISDIRVAPLVQSRWNQGAFAGSNCYNYYTPNNYICGCVATAMSQLMRYHNHPATGVGTPAFTIHVDTVSQTRNLRGGNGSGGAYNWGSMVLVPNATITAEQRQAIGALTHDAGVSVNMDYTADNSGADTLQASSAFTVTFGYSNSKKGHNLDYSNLPATERNHMVNPNLDASYPVLFGIKNAGGGHAIVGDGYGYNASTLYHHLNMGWSGANDAWYNLPTIDDSYYGFDTVYKAVYNVFPSGTGEIISGRVTDASGTPLSGVTITASRSGGGSYTATTNAKGIYALAKVPSASTYTITAGKTGYAFDSLSVSTGTSTDNTTTTGNHWGANLSEKKPAKRGGLPWLMLLLGDSSAPPPPPPPTCPIISNGGFESGRTVWTEYSSHGWSLIINSGFPISVTPHSGSWAAWLGGDYDDISYIQQQVTVPSTCPYLAFYHWIASSDTCGYDFGTTRINGTVVDTVNLCSLTDTGGWVLKSINLSAYSGQSVTLQIGATTDESLNSNWFIDDVSFRNAAAASQSATGEGNQPLPVIRKNETATKASIWQGEEKTQDVGIVKQPR